MKPRREPFLGWPSWGVLGDALLWGTATTLLWIVVYAGADWLTSLRAERVRIHLDVELSIPFVPAFLLVYRSIDVMFLLGPFILRSQPEVRALTRTLSIVIAIAGVGFLLVPAAPAYPPQDAGVWKPLAVWNQHIVLTYNMAPSLHVALSVATLSAYGARRDKLGQGLLASWAAAIALSTLLTHQHHLLDVVTGAILGWSGYRLLYRRWAPVPQIAPASRSSDPAPPA
jgi:membrane-associated phospholipid phosphatase